MKELVAKLQNTYEKWLSITDFSPFRQKVWQKFCALDVQQCKKDYPYYSEKIFALEDFSLLEKSTIIEKLPGKKGIVFIDGIFSKELSYYDHSWNISFVEEENKELTSVEEQDFFSLLNALFHRQTIHISLPDSVKTTKPLEILFYFSSQAQKKYFFPRIVFSLGRNSFSSIYFSLQRENSQNSFTFMPSITTQIEERAQCNFVTLYTTENSSITSGDLYRFFLKRSSSLHLVNFSSGFACRQLRSWINLNGHDASCSVSSFSILQNAMQDNVYVSVNHNATNTEDIQKYKSILLDQAKYSCIGDVLLTAAAQKAKSRQIANSLLLSKESWAYATPILRVFADDVKATHGASVAQFDEKQLFYLRSRGLSSSAAKKVLVKAFTKEFLIDIKNEDIAKDIALMLSKILSKGDI